MYTDINFLSKHYGRYIDGEFSLVITLDEASFMFTLIADEDPDRFLHWEHLDFPESDIVFTQFLGTKIPVHNNELHHKFYRKHQQKNITFHYHSHHPLKLKHTTPDRFNERPHN